jgi:acyl-CoA synthetase (AMP-forming)/AMP-acid ligase II
MLELLGGQESSRPAIVDNRDGRTLSYGDLTARVTEAAARLVRIPGRPVTLLLCTNTVDSIVLYLACLEARVPVCLCDAREGGYAGQLAEGYRPELILAPSGMAAPEPAAPSRFPGTSYEVRHLVRNRGFAAAHPDLALLLTTSGSTGSPKLVRLSLNSIVANARSIVSYLALSEKERSIQGLPMHYSYGLSLINSHLMAGGTIVLTPHPFYATAFWQDFDRSACTSFAGVPYMYEMLTRLRFEPATHPTLRAMTQAGGGLRPDLIRAIHRRASQAGVRFFVMYGQTEATARISYVPPESLEEKAGSIGVPIPGGRLEMERVEDLDACELVYSGANVMMGYAESAACLARGDELNGVLRTGDLARRDGDGYFYLTGRLKRIAKLFGRRINLAELENEIETAFPVRAAVVEGSQQLMVYLEAGGVSSAAVRGHIARRLCVPPKFVAVSDVGAIPMTASGKKDYAAFAA